MVSLSQVKLSSPKVSHGFLDLFLNCHVRVSESPVMELGLLKRFNATEEQRVNQSAILGESFGGK